MRMRVALAGVVEVGRSSTLACLLPCGGFARMRSGR
jgi:hypothetical protein